MRGSHRKGLTVLLTVGTLVVAPLGCGEGAWVPIAGTDAVKSAAAVRAERRLYDGAPPVVPHQDFGSRCSACHDGQGMPVSGLGFAPASPHDATRNAGATQRCRQCHVFVLADDEFVGSSFQGLRQDLRRGSRLAANAPPTIPHLVLMRENCTACHSGPAARAEIVTSHPERVRCRQCHVPVTTGGVFTSTHAEGLVSPEGS
jgi:cytochrome c-type protein NapB